MGLSQGSLSVTRYKVISGISKLNMESLNKRLSARKAGPLKVLEVDKEELNRFVRPEGLDDIHLSEKDHWELSDCQISGGFVFRMRSETRKVAAPLIQHIFKEKLIEHDRSHEKPMSRNDRTKLRDEIRLTLMKTTPPALSFVDACWLTDREELLIFSSSKKACDKFTALFMDAFSKELDLSLVPIIPPLLGLNEKVWKDEKSDEAFMTKLAVTVPVSLSASI